MARSPDFFRQLRGGPDRVDGAPSLEELEEFGSQDGITGPECLRWLTKRNVSTSRAAVARWLQDFKLEYKTRRASEVARSCLATAREGDPLAVTEATLVKMEEAVFEKLVSGDELSAGELKDLSTAMGTRLKSRRELLDQRRIGRDELGKLAGESKKRQITAEDIERVSKAVFG